MTKLAAVLGVIILTQSGCCTLIPYHPTCEKKTYAVGWKHMGDAPPARCIDALLAVAEEKVPCAAAKPLHGFIVWHPAPFMCDLQMVWGCSSPLVPFAEIYTVTAPHASDTAVAEEVGHWIWPRCFPGVKTEWYEKDPVTGRTIEVRDPAFKQWYLTVRGEARARCP